MIDEKTIVRMKTMLPLLNEKQRRLYLAAEANSLGWGGVSQISKALNVSRSMIYAGMRDLESGDTTLLNPESPVRRKGGGRKPGLRKQEVTSEETQETPETQE